MNENDYSRIEDKQVLGEAILFMRSRPRNPDGTIGFIVKPDMPEWPAWEAYFEANQMDRQLGVMRARNFSGYTVPCANPSTFDPTFRGMGRPKPRSVDLSGEERERIVRDVLEKNQFRPKTAKPFSLDDVRNGTPPLPETREMTEREAESMRRLMGAARRDIAAE